MKLQQIKAQFKNAIPIEVITKSKYNSLVEYFEFTGFENKKFQTVLMDKTLYVSQKGMKTSSDWRDLGVVVGKAIQKTKAEASYIELDKLQKEFLEGVMLSDYTFDQYKSEKKEKTTQTLYINFKEKVNDKHLQKISQNRL